MECINKLASTRDTDNSLPNFAPWRKHLHNKSGKFGSRQSDVNQLANPNCGNLVSNSEQKQIMLCCLIQLFCFQAKHACTVPVWHIRSRCRPLHAHLRVYFLQHLWRKYSGSLFELNSDRAIKIGHNKYRLSIRASRQDFSFSLDPMDSRTDL